MAGGLMTLAAVGAENIILNGNPKKTFFKAKYNKYTNFGMQRFRIDYKGLRQLKILEDTEMNFVVPRYADLLNDVYVVVNLPNIYSSVYWPSTSTKGAPYDKDDYDSNCNFRGSGYEFKWIECLGAQMIKQVSIHGGGQILAQYSGEFLDCLKERDFTEHKKKLWDKMTGNIPELNDPANTNGNINVYPSVIFNGQAITEPSIRGRQLIIPIEAWFGTQSKTALPLVAIQYCEISIKITFRPVQELFRIRDVEDLPNGFPYVAPCSSNELHSFYRFLHPPMDASSAIYQNKRTDWNADVHLLANYIFLDDDERGWFAETEQQYLIQQVYERDYFNVTGTRSIELQSRDLVPSYMWRFRRSDVHLRNEWCNYTNWPYNNILPVPPDATADRVDETDPNNCYTEPSPSPNIFVYTNLNEENQKKILLDLGIILDGEYRENVLPAAFYEYAEKWIRTIGDARDGIYCYNFCIDSNKREYQPSGAQNMSTFNSVRFEFNTMNPPQNPEGKKFDVICSEPTEGNPNGVVIGVRKNAFELYEYTYDLRVFEIRYNILSVISGRVGLMYAR